MGQASPNLATRLALGRDPSSKSPHLASPVELKERIEAERAGKPFLVYRGETGGQEIVSLTSGETTLVGRGDECGVCLHWDPRVSAVHAELYETAGHWVVADDGLSRNGTYLNGERVAARQRLDDGDQLDFGTTSFVFRNPRRRSLKSTAAAGRKGSPPELSPAQRRVLVALCRPFRDGASFATPATNQQIADELHLSVPAVKTHLRALCQRFGVAGLPQNEKRVALVKAALDRAAISPSDLTPPND